VFLPGGRRSHRASDGFADSPSGEAGNPSILVSLRGPANRSPSPAVGLLLLLGRQQREASRGPGGGNEPPGRRHEVGEIRQGGPQPRPLASPLIRTGRSATDRRTNESRAPTKTTRRSRRQGISCPHVEASKVPTRSREQSPCVPALRRRPPVSDDPSRAPAAGGFAVSPATRAGTTFYPCRSDPGSCTTYCVRRPTTRSQDREGEPI